MAWLKYHDSSAIEYNRVTYDMIGEWHIVETCYPQIKGGESKTLETNSSEHWDLTKDCSSIFNAVNISDTKWGMLMLMVYYITI